MTANVGRHIRHPFPRLAPQRGAALLFVVLLLVIGTGLFVINASQETLRVVQSDKVLTGGLHVAKEALIAYAVAHPPRPNVVPPPEFLPRPGALPCPDTNDDGVEETIVAGACPSYLGRLPWRTLGLGDVRDEAGERYWYALSPNFRDAVPINSDSKGNITIRSLTAAVTQTTEAVAVVFSPGGVLAGQSRNPTPAACATTGTNIAGTWCAANYLETASGVNNAAPSPPPGASPTYITAEPATAFNDRLIALRTSDVIPLVERRVAADMRRALLLYREASRLAVTKDGCNCYPWADEDNNGTSNQGINKGYIPLAALPHPWSPQPPAAPVELEAADGTRHPLPPLPPYFVANNWRSVIYYAVGRNALENYGLFPTACTTCSGDTILPPPVFLGGTLSIDKSTGHAVVLITPGSAGANRPIPGGWGNYIDDGMNRDKDDRFVTPTSKSLDRDRLLTIPDDTGPAACKTNSQILIKNAPCHTTGNNVKPVCKKAENNLQICGCSGDATVMNQPPCRNTLNPGACKTAVANLQACKA